MSKVNLRAYDHEVESLIEQGHLDEAIAHCRNILKSYPKHLETYRLLGKCYLEAKRYEEAMDIFNRTLMAVPDDFVSHVGMSIIHDEKGKLDDALWHMERAFESQPSNAAIQGELQRLYGRRDGVEPPRIRMTRGALAHMYVQGELYPQAISEIRAVLTQDAQRSDMQVLLAVTYYRSGQKADAAQACNQLLKRNPYCFEANRIMVDLLHGKPDAESTQVYRQRVVELDPYAAFTRDSIYRVVEVPDSSINLERLSYSGEEVSMGRDWNSKQGIHSKAEGQAESQPEWLKAGASGSKSESEGIQSTAATLLRGAGAKSEASERELATTATTRASTAEKPPIESSPPSGQDIPEFLRQAGWKESDIDQSEGSDFSPFAGTQADKNKSAPIGSADDELMPADLPEWIKDKAPKEKDEARVEAEALPDWLDSLTGAAAEYEKSVKKPVEESRDWLKGMSPADLQAAGLKAPIPEASTTEATFAGAPAAHDHEISQTPRDKDRVDVKETNVQPPSSSPETLGPSEKEQDEALAWLETLAAKHGAKSEELLTDPAERKDEPPRWVGQARSMSEAQPDPSKAESVEAQGDDETGLWLRGLIEKETEGRSSEIPVSDETPVPPDQNAASRLLGSDVELGAEAPPLAAESEIPGWLKELDTERNTEVTTSHLAGEEATPPDWLKDLDSDSGPAKGPRPGEQEKPIVNGIERGGPVGPDIGMDAEKAVDHPEMPDWLKGVDEESAFPLPSKSFDQPAEQEDYPKADFDSIQGKKVDDSKTGQQILDKSRVDQDVEQEPAGMPDWLKADENLPSEPSKFHEEEPTFPRIAEEQKSKLSGEGLPSRDQVEGQLPDWMQGLGKDQPIRKASVPVDTMPAWLKGEAEEPPRAEPTAPSDWRPIEGQIAGRSLDQAQHAEPGTGGNQQQPASEAGAAPSRSTTSAGGELPDLENAQNKLGQGDIPAALEEYNRLIRQGRSLEESIRDLREAVYRYPVEVSIWQALGDAYMRANRLQEALDAFNKAEELLR